MPDPKEMTGVAASAIVRTEREERRESLRGIVARNPAGKLAHKALTQLKDMKALDDLVEEAGGEERLLTLIYARVNDGQTVVEFCEEFEVSSGLVGRMLQSTPERYAGYLKALEWVADGLVAESVKIAATPQMGVIRKIKADGSEEVTEEDMLGHRKLRVDTHLKVAARFDRARFGLDPGAGVTVNVPVVQPGDTTELARRVAFLLRKGVEEQANTEDVEVIDVPPEAA